MRLTVHPKARGSVLLCLPCAILGFSGFPSLCMTILRRWIQWCAVPCHGISSRSTHHQENTRHSRAAQHYVATPLCMQKNKRYICIIRPRILLLLIGLTLLSGKRLITKEARRPRRSTRIPALMPSKLAPSRCISPSVLPRYWLGLAGIPTMRIPC